MELIYVFKNSIHCHFKRKTNFLSLFEYPKFSVLMNNLETLDKIIALLCRSRAATTTLFSLLSGLSFMLSVHIALMLRWVTLFTWSKGPWQVRDWDMGEVDVLKRSRGPRFIMCFSFFYFSSLWSLSTNLSWKIFSVSVLNWYAADLCSAVGVSFHGKISEPRNGVLGKNCFFWFSRCIC